MGLKLVLVDFVQNHRLGHYSALHQLPHGGLNTRPPMCAQRRYYEIVQKQLRADEHFVAFNLSDLTTAWCKPAPKR